MRFVAILLFLISSIAECSPIKILCVHSNATSRFVLQENISGLSDAFKKHGVISDKEHEILSINKKMQTSIIDFDYINVESNTLDPVFITNIQNFNPDIIVTTDKQSFLAVTGKYLNTKYPIIFFGIDQYEINQQNIKEIMQNGKNLISVNHGDLLAKSFKLFNELAPEVKNVAIVGDGSELSNVMLKELEKNISNNYNIVQTLLNNDANILKNNLIKMSAAKNVDGFIILSLQNLHDHHQLFPYYQFVEWYAENILLPEITFDKIYVSRGLLCNAYFCNYRQGYLAGEHIAKMIANQQFNPSLFQYKDENIKEIINLKRAKKLNITKIKEAENRFSFEK